MGQQYSEYTLSAVLVYTAHIRGQYAGDHDLGQAYKLCG